MSSLLSGAKLAHRHAKVASDSHAPHGGIAALTVSALAIVHGSIGTSPLYAIDQIFGPSIARTPDNVLGGLSLVVWTITLIAAVNYAILVLRAQNDGEGGVFALYGLLHDLQGRGIRGLLWALMLGAGLLIGDGIISPAISILSAVEGFAVATPAFGGLVVPVTIGLLSALFAIQFKGTAGIGRIFGPVMGLWFVVIAALGLWQIIQHPAILAALNPAYGLGFLARIEALDQALVIGALVLVVTGSEAMYADVGHFGALPIRISWFAVAYPALLLAYLGQGAYMLGGAPVVGDKLFYSLVPSTLLYPVVGLATLATIIAAQGLISGVFSLTSQAVRLGLFPRIAILHTHQAHAGQIYVPFINAMLLAGCALLVMTFGSSAALASAYGLTVSGVMIITCVAMGFVARLIWQWSRALTVAVWGTMTFASASFVFASALKFLEGGFVPVTVGFIVFAVMATWRWGRKATFAAYSAKTTMTMGDLVTLHRASPVLMQRTAVVMAAKPLRSVKDHAPALIDMMCNRTGILPRDLVFVEVTHAKVPTIKDNRFQVTVFHRDPDRGSIIGVELSFGFMEEPNVERLLEDMTRHREIELPRDRHRWIVHVAHENLLPSRGMNRLKRLRLALFMVLRLLSRPSYLYYGLGDEVQLTVEIIPVRVH